MVRKQCEVMQFISKYNDRMFGHLETKIKRSTLGQAYSKFFNRMVHHKSFY